MISAAAWIAKGRAARHPTKYAVDDAELDRVSKLANVHFEDAKAQLERASKAAAGWHDDRSDGEGGDEGWEDDDNEDEGGEEDGETEMETDAAAHASADDGNESASKEGDDPNDLSRYNLDAYDDDNEADASKLGPFSNIKGLQYYRNNDEDPYITMRDEMQEDEEEREELEVLPGDNLIVCAKTEDEVSLLEAYIYTPDESNLFVHHDLMLPSFPLCLEWLDYKPAGAGSADQNSAVGQVGSFLAVGTMDPEIEIWSMDVVEGLFPDALLGRRDMTEGLGAPKGTGKKSACSEMACIEMEGCLIVLELTSSCFPHNVPSERKQIQERVANPAYHVDAVLGLSWNRMARNLLCSASADTTIKLWDLSRPAETTSTSGGVGALRSFDDIHTDKVQSISWDTSGSALGTIAQPARLLSGSYDKTLCVFDSRSPGTSAVRARVSADVEAVKWHPWHEHNFVASFEDGIVQSFDARMLSSQPQPKPAAQTVFTLAAHDGACTSLDISAHIPGCIVTGGSDKQVKLWSLDEDEAQHGGATTAPKSINLVAGRDLDAGKIFSTQFSPDDPLTLVAAGSKGVLRVWDALANVGARKTFGARLQKHHASSVRIDGTEPARGDGVVRVADESDDDDDDEEDGEQVAENGNTADGGVRSGSGRRAARHGGGDDVAMEE